VVGEVLGEEGLADAVGSEEDECPVGAIHHENDVPSEHRTDIAANARFFAERRANA
jgi:hypothetical protein